MLRQLRQDLGAEDVPVILGELSENITEKWIQEGRNLRMNRNLRELAAEIPNCTIASSEALTLKPDGIHFDSVSCREFGKRYFAQFLKMAK